MQRSPRHAWPSPAHHLPRLAVHLVAPQLPAPNAENDDHNPPRIAPRNLFDLSFGEDNLLRRKSADKRTLSASLTIVNLTNKYALYNFLSTFSGTHFVSPRSLTAQLAYHF